MARRSTRRRGCCASASQLWTASLHTSGCEQARLLRERFGGREVTAVTLATNAPMLSFLAGSGFERTGEFENEWGRQVESLQHGSWLLLLRLLSPPDSERRLQVEWRLALRGAAAGEAARVDAGLARYVGPFLGENLLHRASSRSGGAGGTTWQPVTDGSSPPTTRRPSRGGEAL